VYTLAGNTTGLGVLRTLCRLQVASPDPLEIATRLIVTAMTRDIRKMVQTLGKMVQLQLKVIMMPMAFTFGMRGKVDMDFKSQLGALADFPSLAGETEQCNGKSDSGLSFSKMFALVHQSKVCIPCLVLVIYLSSVRRFKFFHSVSYIIETPHFIASSLL
jgi:hypothetical protein